MIWTAKIRVINLVYWLVWVSPEYFVSRLPVSRVAVVGRCCGETVRSEGKKSLRVGVPEPESPYSLMLGNPVLFRRAGSGGY